MRLGTLVPSDLRGGPVPNRETRTTDWYPGSFLPNAARDGDAGILSLEEYVQAPPSMQALAQRLVHLTEGLDAIPAAADIPTVWVVPESGSHDSAFEHGSVSASPGTPRTRASERRGGTLVHKRNQLRPPRRAPTP